MKGILFTEILYNKTVRKEKTMTRRSGKSLSVVNEYPDNWIKVTTNFEWGGFSSPDKSGIIGVGFSKKGSGLAGLVDPQIICKPNYKVGEVVYIKEPVGVNKNDCSLSYMYDYVPEAECRTINKKDWNWGNKMFMKAELARHYIRITDVRVERLFDISDEDCIKEGVDKHHSISGKFINYLYPERGGFFMDNTTGAVGFRKNKKGKWLLSAHCENPQESFFSLFRFANKIPKSRELKNIWTFVYEYHLCDKEGNKL